jgi:hypothetical protein
VALPHWQRFTRCVGSFTPHSTYFIQRGKNVNNLLYGIIVVNRLIFSQALAGRKDGRRWSSREGFSKFLMTAYSLNCLPGNRTWDRFLHCSEKKVVAVFSKYVFNGTEWCFPFILGKNVIYIGYKWKSQFSCASSVIFRTMIYQVEK